MGRPDHSTLWRRLHALGDLAQDAQFADVVGIVVGHDQDLPQDGVLVVARDRAEEVSPVIGHDGVMRCAEGALAQQRRFRWQQPAHAVDLGDF